ncbi:MAG: hypothetical protein EOP46_18975 [Sphingobacteriaceae bacterium]|nr:MAG: hypothetical protein EOP46_18975 [Sphingobacteriaceae bacterium]
MIVANNTVEIPISKTKTFLLVIGSLVFVITSIWLWTIADEQTRRSPLLIKIVSLLGISFFGFGFIIGIKKLFNKTPGLIIDSEGILDSTTVAGELFIPWLNITGFEVIKIKSTKILLIYVDNASYLMSKKSHWKQRIMRFTEQQYGTPIAISSATLKISFTDLEKLLSDRHKLYGKAIA